MDRQGEPAEAVIRSIKREPAQQDLFGKLYTDMS